MRVLVCGDRNWSDPQVVHVKLDELHAEERIDVIIEGGANGADTMARAWAVSRGVSYWEFPAKWQEFGKAAGPLRNARMLVEGKPDRAVAFHGDLANSKGTLNMVRLCQKAGIPVVVFGATR